jgi:formate-dependent nitrite reductase membrane component NrfD
MNAVPSSTWFSAPPHWGWYIALYFFLGGLAGGSYFLAATIDVIGRREDRPLARLGYYIAFPCVALSGLLLTLDLGRPLRFWHMLIESNTYRPMFKYWSPMSTGAWALLIFGLFTFLSFVAALGEEDSVRPRALRTLAAKGSGFRTLRPPSALGRAVSIVGAIFALYIAGYTGVLLAVTNRPVWSDTPLIGMLFMLSAASTSAAMIILLAHRAGWTPPGLADMRRTEEWAIVLELLAVVAVAVSLGPVVRYWLSVWGMLLVVAVVLGMIAPIVLSWRGRRANEPSVVSAVCVLVASLLLRVAIVFSSGAA